jgi:uncharacterized protein involved in exopolysaccharide biosynthesis
MSETKMNARNHLSDSLLLAFIRIAHKHRWLVVGTVVFFTLLGLAAGILSTRSYSATVTAMPRAEQSASSDLGDLIGSAAASGLAGFIQPASGTLKDEAIAILRSRGFVISFVRRHDIAPHLFVDRWDAKAGSWGTEEPTAGEIFDKFSEEVLTASEHRPTGMVKIVATASDPDLAANWANQIFSDINSEIRQRRKESAAKSMEYLYKELEKQSNAGVQQALFGLIEDQIARAMIAEVTSDYALRMIDLAIPPDEDDYVSPKPVLLIFGGMVFGLFAGLGAALTIETIRSIRSLFVDSD